MWLAGKINLKPTSRARYAEVLRTQAESAKVVYDRLGDERGVNVRAATA